jgi:3-methyl-2-oxobutanoate hydroxymethyltransferase
MEKRISITDLKAMKRRGEKIVMITAYDYTSAILVEAAGIPLILVGDTLGNVVLGYDTTVPVTMEDMLHHIKPVVRGTRKTHIVADMPFMSYQASPAEALHNAGRMLKEGGAQSIKLEGGIRVAETVRTIVEAGIPVMGHIGLTPQSYYQMGGWRAQGRTAEAARRLLDDALALEAAGAFAIVLETIPAALAKVITARLHIPTIGIGAGPHCDGQVQVFHDLLGLIEDFLPKHAKRFALLGAAIREAVSAYSAAVRAGSFPAAEHSIEIDEATLAGLEEES